LGFKNPYPPKAQHAPSKWGWQAVGGTMA